MKRSVFVNFYQTILDMINKSFTYAVVWASNDTEKYGHKVFKDLLDAWYKVIATNPNEPNKILDQKVYPTLSDYTQQENNSIDVCIFVVPPQVTEKILEEVKELWIQNVRMQPWAESEQAIQFCKTNNIKYTSSSCIMIQRSR